MTQFKEQTRDWFKGTCTYGIKGYVIVLKKHEFVNKNLIYSITTRSKSMYTRKEVYIPYLYQIKRLILNE